MKILNIKETEQINYLFTYFNLWILLPQIQPKTATLTTSYNGISYTSCSVDTKGGSELVPLDFFFLLLRHSNSGIV